MVTSDQQKSSNCELLTEKTIVGSADKNQR